MKKSSFKLWWKNDKPQKQMGENREIDFVKFKCSRQNISNNKL